jgi:two-component system CheB/CheR fusion protein
MIVAVSGYGQEQDRVRSKSVGFDYHVVKPIDPAVLAGLVGSLRLSRQAALAEGGGAKSLPNAAT